MGCKCLTLLIACAAMLCCHFETVIGTSFIYVANSTLGNDTSACWSGGQKNPCSTLSYALEGVHKTSNATYHPGIFLELVDQYYILSESAFSTFDGLSNPNISNVVITGSTACSTARQMPCVLVKCKGNSSGLSFMHVSNVTIQHVFFTEGCGAVHNSTSKNSSSLFTPLGDIHFAKFRVALYFSYCKNIFFNQVFVEHSPGTGVVVYATGGTNVFQDCRFDNNHDDLPNGYPGGGGFYLEFPYCSPGMEYHCETDIPPGFVTNSSYIFRHCSFNNNRARVNDTVDGKARLSVGEDHVAFGRGGGLSVFFKGMARNNSVTVEECYFVTNSALWGGGLFTEFQDNSTYNQLFVYNSTFESNECQYDLSSAKGNGGGGGVRIGYLFFDNLQVKHNNILFDNCTFQYNTAYFGGGLSFYAPQEQGSLNATNTLEFNNCVWLANRARFGAAIDFSLWNTDTNGSIVHVKLRNANITHHNTTSILQLSGSAFGLGAIYVDTIPLQFHGHANFQYNEYSALAAVNSRIDFLGRCIANFFHNSGQTGGAIALFGSSFIRVHNGTHMNFFNNCADFQGGAIYSEGTRGHDLLSSRNCFVRYKDIETAPEDWKAYFNFTNNTAANCSNSIYTSTVLPCLWGSPEVDKVFRWSSHWHYSSNGSEEIQSAPAAFGNDLSNVEVFPGHRQALPVLTVDDLENNATYRTVYTAYSQNTSVAVLDESSRYISDNAIKLYGVPGMHTTIRLYTLNPRVLFLELNVSLNHCPPGFVPNTFVPDSTTECICDTRYSYNNLVRCSRTDFTAQLQVQGLWIGECGDACEDRNLLVAGYSPYTYTLNETQLQLPHFESNLSRQLCGPSHRHGTACGSCITGYAPSFNSHTYECVKCSDDDIKYHWIFFLLTEMLPQTVLFAILMLFNVSLTSGPANAFLLFAQVITASFGLYITQIPPYNKLRYASDIIYGIWNLNFFDPVIPSYCLSPNLTTATVIALNYVVAVYPLLLIVIFFLVNQLFDHGHMCPRLYNIFRPVSHAYAKLRQKYNLREAGYLDALAAFLLLSYTKLVNISIMLLSPMHLQSSDGSIKTTIMYHDGTIAFFTLEHVPYLLSAVIILLVFVIPPPLLLLAYPIKTCRSFLRWLACKQSEEDGRFIVELKHFLDTFYGCYKDGHGEQENKTWDLRFFAAVYFLCRISFTALDSSNLDYSLQYAMQQLVCIAVALFIFLVRPYKIELFNYVDGTIFSILGAINALSSYNYVRDRYARKGPSPVVFAFQYVLMWLPLLYLCGYLLLHFLKKRREKRDRARALRIQVANESEEDDRISDNSIMCLVDERAREDYETERSRSGDSGSKRSSGAPSASKYGSTRSTVHGATP